MEHLNRTIQEQERWTIKNMGELQYCFEEDFYQIVFQMDDLYGFVMVVDKEKKYDEVLDFIKKYTL